MLISIDQWLASIGIFYGHVYALICKLAKLNLNNIDFFISYFFNNSFVFVVIFAWGH